MCDIEKNEIINYYDSKDNYKKSNFLIGAKYKSSLWENKILALCLSKINDAFEDDKGNLIVKLKGSEVKQVFGSSSGNFYKRLYQISLNMGGRIVGIIDPESQYFDIMPVVARCTYDSGEFTMIFNGYLNKYLKDIKSNYTQLSLQNIMSFSSVYALRLYEIIRSKMYYPKGVINRDNKFAIKMSIAELKLEMGVVDIDQTSIKNKINKENPDYDEMLKNAKGMYESWSEFRKFVIEPSMKEINEKSELEVDYDTTRVGRGGKTKFITLYAKVKEIKGNSQDVVPYQLTEEEKEDIECDVLRLIKEPIRMRDAKAILTAANYSYERVKEVYETTAGKEISNLVGFMIAGLKNDYQTVPSKAEPKSNTPNTQFHRFEQNEYDMNKLEEALLNK